MGAAVLAVRACLRSGAGLTTAVVPACGYEIMQTAAPEAMCLTPSLADDANPMTVSGDFDPAGFTAVGIGPGIGTNRDSARALKTVLDRCRRPLVLDADALNILSENKDWLKKVPAGSVLTPHPKEFGRLAGVSSDDFDRHRQQREFSKKHGVVVVLKGRYTCTSDPAGRCRFNTTGNPGLAKGGTGDALTGVITALLAQGLAPADAAAAGVYVHGLAADVAARRIGVTALLASDVIRRLGDAFTQASG
jgi:NAD(P)H-hydrate epimerase